MDELVNSYIIYLCKNYYMRNRDVFTNSHYKKNNWEVCDSIIFEEELINILINSLISHEGDISQVLQSRIVNYVTNVIHNEKVNNHRRSLLVKEMMSNNTYPEKTNTLSKYSLADSILVELDNRIENTCRCNFLGVLIYNDYAENLREAVEVEDLSFVFKNVKQVSIIGNLDFATDNVFTVLDVNHKVNDNYREFRILCISNFKHLIFSIEYKNVEIETYRYEGNNPILMQRCANKIRPNSLDYK